MDIDLTKTTTVPGVLSAQVDGIPGSGAAVVCVLPGQPVAITLGSVMAVTVQFDAVAVRGLLSILSASLKHMEGRAT